MLLLHFAFKSTSFALCFFRNGPLGSGYFLSFAIRMRQPFDAKKGDAAIITRFLQLGYKVLTPYGGNQRYDLVIEDADGQFWRIQCKSAWIVLFVEILFRIVDSLMMWYWPGLVYRRRNAALSAGVPMFHMLSAMLIVTPGGTIWSMRSSTSLDRSIPAAAR